MAKGGRYLNTNQKAKKKGKGLKILLIVLLVLALLLAGLWFAFQTFMGSMLGNVQRAEVVEQNEDKSYEDLMAEIYGNMDFGTEDMGEEMDDVPAVPETSSTAE